MIFTPTRLAGAFVIEPEKRLDERGFFARSWCAQEFEAHGLSPSLVQCNISFNARAGTLRGMHFQSAPHQEAKLVRCTRGSIFDVILDLRPHSPTFKQWQGFELSAANHRALYVPEGFAHGLQTLEDNSEVFYQMSTSYVPGAQAGVRWDDPAFDIEWPHAERRTIAEKDMAFPDFDAASFTP